MSLWLGVFSFYLIKFSRTVETYLLDILAHPKINSWLRPLGLPILELKDYHCLCVESLWGWNITHYHVLKVCFVLWVWEGHWVYWGFGIASECCERFCLCLCLWDLWVLFVWVCEFMRVIVNLMENAFGLG